MIDHPTIKLSVLHQIGWDHWDPIAILQLNDDDWRTNAADEYDSYLLHVVSMLRRGESEVDTVAYLEKIAAEHMGLGQRTAEGRDAAAATVTATSGYLRTLPDGPLRVR